LTLSKFRPDKPVDESDVKKHDEKEPDQADGDGIIVRYRVESNENKCCYHGQHAGQTKCSQNKNDRIVGLGLHDAGSRRALLLILSCL
jgi:hypothetical protein